MRSEKTSLKEYTGVRKRAPFGAPMSEKNRLSTLKHLREQKKRERETRKAEMALRKRARREEGKRKSESIDGSMGGSEAYHAAID